MGLFDAEHLIGQLLASELGGGSRKKRKKRLSKSVRKAALSPQGLTLLAGLAFAAVEHLKSKNAAAAGGGYPQTPPQPGGAPTLPGGTPPPPLPRSSSVPGGAPAFTAGGSAAPRPSNLPPIPGSASRAPDAGAALAPEEGDRRARVLVRAMVEAAKADGTVEPVERARILEQLEAAGADAEARGFVVELLERPLDLDGILAWVDTSDTKLAAEVYVASRVVIADETPAESAYLALLAARLGLSEELVRELRMQVDQALEPVDPA